MKTLKFEYTDDQGSRKIREVMPIRIAFEVGAQGANKEWLLEAMDIASNNKENFLLKNIERMIDEQTQRFLCVTVYVMDAERRFLMLHNRKLNKWVPAGGKVDRHETPDQAAVRECFEETGVTIELCGEKTFVEGGLVRPYGVQLNQIIPLKRDHVDLIYLGRPLVDEPLKRSEREASDIGWFTFDEVAKLDTFPSVIQWSDFFRHLPSNGK